MHCFLPNFSNTQRMSWIDLINTFGRYKYDWGAGKKYDWGHAMFHGPQSVGSPYITIDLWEPRVTLRNKLGMGRSGICVVGFPADAIWSLHVYKWGSALQYLYCGLKHWVLMPWNRIFSPLEVSLWMGLWCCSHHRFQFSFGLMFCIALTKSRSKVRNYFLVSYTDYQEPSRMTSFSFKKKA